MTFGRELIEYLRHVGTMLMLCDVCYFIPTKFLWGVIILQMKKQRSREMKPKNCQGGGGGGGDSQNSKLHLSNIKALCPFILLCSDIRWSVIFSNGPANSLSHMHLTPGNISEICWQKALFFGMVSTAEILCMSGGLRGLQLQDKSGCFSTLVY